ncbi:tail fiber assembly protein [Serratia sp. NPDC087055]
MALDVWKTYRALLSRINLEDAPDIGWPDVPA